MAIFAVNATPSAAPDLRLQQLPFRYSQERGKQSDDRKIFLKHGTGEVEKGRSARS